MNPISDGCRLCLDSLAECFTTIDNPQLEEQMQKVFCFPIVTKQGYSSGVCQSCSYAISEFFQYSEKVRQNQEILNENVTNSDPTIDSKITLESVKIETLSDFGLPETADHACELKDEVLGEEVPTLDSIITIENVKIETLSDSGLPETTEDACKTKKEVTGAEGLYEPSSKKSKIRRKGSTSKTKLEALGADEPTKNSKQFIRSTQQELNEQDQLFNKHFSMICDLCGMSAVTFTELRRHFWTEHKRSSGYIVCCKKKLFGRYEIRNHINFHAKLDEPTRNSKQFTRSTQQELNEEDQLFKKHFRMVCDLCGTSAVNFTELRRHFWKAHKRPSGYVVCCKKKLFGRYAIRNHIDFHANPDVFRCEVCGNKYKNKINLNEHMFCMHSGDGHGPLKCDHCPQSFAQKSALAKHMEWHVKLKCSKCNKMFARKSGLCNHISRQHSGKDRTIACDTCGQKFLTKRAFDRHMNDHMGIKVQRFQCEICRRWLKSSRNLRNHMNIVHSNGEQAHQTTATEAEGAEETDVNSQDCSILKVDL